MTVVRPDRYFCVVARSPELHKATRHSITNAFFPNSRSIGNGARIGCRSNRCDTVRRHGAPHGPGVEVVRRPPRHRSKESRPRACRIRVVVVKSASARRQLPRSVARLFHFRASAPSTDLCAGSTISGTRNASVRSVTNRSRRPNERHVGRLRTESDVAVRHGQHRRGPVPKPPVTGIRSRCTQ